MHLVRGGRASGSTAERGALSRSLQQRRERRPLPPRVVEAIAGQLAVLNTHTRYLHEDGARLCRGADGDFPPELSQVMLTCTGSEANDLAVRIARTVTGGTGIIVTELAYHGVTATVARVLPLARPRGAPRCTCPHRPGTGFLPPRACGGGRALRRRRPRRESPIWSATASVLRFSSSIRNFRATASSPNRAGS